MTEAGMATIMLISFCIGVVTGLVAPHIVSIGITSAMPVITIPNEYPPECMNTHYVKGNGSKKSDYFYDTTPEECKEYCYPTAEMLALDNSYYQMTLREKCACCHARWQI